MLFNKKKLFDFALIFCLVMLLMPFLFLCLYIHPSADDLIYASWYKAPVPIDFWNYQLGSYMTWTGRYFSTFLLSLNPMYFGSFWTYKLFPILLVSLFYGSLFLFLKTVFIKLNKKYVHIIALLITLSYLNIVPSLPETIYWISAAVTYFLSWSLLFFLFTYLIRYYHNLGASKTNVVLIFISTFFIIGTNELSAFFVCFIAFGILLYHAVVHRRKNRFAFIFLIYVLCLTLVVVLAPGNKVRLSYFDNHYNLGYALSGMVFNTVKIFAYNFNSPSFIVFALLILINAENLKGKSFFLKATEQIGYFILLAGGLLIIMFFYFTSAYNTGIPAPLRVHNYLILFVILYVFFGIILLSYKVSLFTINKSLLNKLNVLLIAVYCFFIITDFYKKDGSSYVINGNVIQAVYDIKHDAPVYNTEMKARYKIIEKAVDEGKSSVLVPALTVKPQSIYFTDIRSDSSHWINWGYANYFNLEYVSTD